MSSLGCVAQRPRFLDLAACGNGGNIARFVLFFHHSFCHGTSFHMLVEKSRGKRKDTGALRMRFLDEGALHPCWIARRQR